MVNPKGSGSFPLSGAPVLIVEKNKNEYCAFWNGSPQDAVDIILEKMEAKEQGSN